MSPLPPLLPLLLRPLLPSASGASSRGALSGVVEGSALRDRAAWASRLCGQDTYVHRPWRSRRGPASPAAAAAAAAASPTGPSKTNAAASLALSTVANLSRRDHQVSWARSRSSPPGADAGAWDLELPRAARVGAPDGRATGLGERAPAGSSRPIGDMGGGFRWARAPVSVPPRPRLEGLGEGPAAGPGPSP